MKQKTKTNKPKSKEKKKLKKEDSSKKRAKVFLMGLVSVLFISGIAGLAVITYKVLYKSDYFFIKKTAIEWQAEPLSRGPYKKLLMMGKGSNIFKFDIKKAAHKIKEAYPGLKNIILRRDFPDKLTYLLRPRVPVAQVGDKSFFLVDEEGVILTEMLDQIDENLPIVSGVGWRFTRRIGQREDSERMRIALKLLDAIKGSDLLSEHMLSKIDVSDYKNILFYIEDGLEIKIGHSSFIERITRLKAALESMMIDKDEIEYVDLRFDDVVLGTK